MEAKLQKLKVTELKELLSKHNLPQTGKKDDLVKRLLENNVSVDDAGEEELVDIDDAPAPATTSASATAKPAAPASAPAAPASAESNGETIDLTPEQQAMKARAERFGMPFNPNASRPTKPEPAGTSKPTTAAATEPKTAAPKAGAIDKAPLGLSDEVLAKRAAKFGLPEKKAAPAPTTAPAAPKAPAAKPEVEMTPEMKEKIAIEEEKKRKRAEKFGLALPTNGTDTEPDAKKAKV